MVLFWWLGLCYFLPLGVVSIDVWFFWLNSQWLFLELNFGESEIVLVEHFVVADGLRLMFQFFIIVVEHLHVVLELGIREGVGWLLLSDHQ